MRTLLLGIDSGTQSTKVLVADAKNGKVLASASQAYDLIPNLPPGAKEQHPHTWRDATAKAIKQALKSVQAQASEVKAIGVSGQQHGFVPLDGNGDVIRPAKLWCDTSTAAECEEIMNKVGGLKATIRAMGNAVLPGFFDTDMTREGLPEAARAFWRNFCPMPKGRMGLPDELADVVLYLASPRASFINGELISVTGGLNATL